MPQPVDFQVLEEKMDFVSWVIVFFFNLLFIALWWFLALPIPASAIALVAALSLAAQYFVVAPSMARTIESMKKPKKNKDG